MRSTIARVVGFAAAALVALAVMGPASASPMVIPLQPQPFSAFSAAGPAAAEMVSAYSYTNTFTGDVTFAGDIYSQAYALSGGSYLYLYEVDNHGPSALEVFAVAPMYSLMSAGYLTSGEPAWFLAGGQAPLGVTYDVAPATPVVSFGYPSVVGAYLPAGGHTAVLYVVSPYAPVVGEGYVIDSGVAVAQVVRPLPEPATLALMTFGGLALARVRRRRAG